MKVDPLHEAVPQLVVAGAFAQLPFPSQRPVNPQGGLAAQPPCGSIASAMTGLHMPAMPATLHDRQLPQLAEAQQTPSRAVAAVAFGAAGAQLAETLEAAGPGVADVPGRAVAVGAAGGVAGGAVARVRRRRTA